MHGRDPVLKPKFDIVLEQWIAFQDITTSLLTTTELTMDTRCGAFAQQ